MGNPSMDQIEITRCQSISSTCWQAHIASPLEFLDGALHASLDTSGRGRLRAVGRDRWVIWYPARPRGSTAAASRGL